MYDFKDMNELQEEKESLRSDCIGDRAYFRQIQYECMFSSLKSVHIPTENIIK